MDSTIRLFGLTRLIGTREQLYITYFQTKLRSLLNFLGGSFTWYGLEAYWYYISDGEQDINSKVNPMEKVFPKVTKCIYKRFGPTASIETNDALCTVPLNILNEKIFVILWFVYWALRILMAIGVTHRILMLFRPFRWVYYSLDLNVKFSTIRHLDKRKILVF